MATSQTYGRWPRRQHVFFDCDATLSRIEGIDVLAAQHGVADFVETLTESAMSGDVALEDVYHRRLDAIGPTDTAIRRVAADYKRHVVDHAREVIGALHRHDHEVYVVSGGLHDPVNEFATYLGVSESNVHAVTLGHDGLDGTWWLPSEQQGRRFSTIVDHQLATSAGKIEVIAALLEGTTGGSMLIGDGMTDLAAAGTVDTFIGFGGVSPRPAIADSAELYIEAASLAAVFPLAGGSAIHADLDSSEATLVHLGVRQVAGGEVQFADAALRDRFLHAFTKEPTT